MQVFSEKVNHTSTNDFLNIIQSESFEEIFYDVFEVQINGNKYPLEKVSSYKSNPVVSVPINVEGVEVFYPFVLIKGKQEIIFNENNLDIPIDVEVPEMIFESLDELEDYQIESKQEIINQIEEAKSNAKLWAEKVKSEKIQEAAQEIAKHKKALDNTLERARESLVEDFLNVAQKIKEDIFSWHSESESKLVEDVNNKILKISEELKSSLSNDFDESSKHFDKNVKAVIKELYQSIVIPKVNSELKSISTDIVEKVSEIESGLYDKLDETLTQKADKTLVESINDELRNVQKLNVELNDLINKGVSKALSRVGKVSKSFEELSEAVDKKINESTQAISQYYTERIKLLENDTFDLNDKTRQYFIDLIEENRDNLIEEIRRIKDEKPVEFIIESSKGDPEKISLDKLTKQLNTDIHNKFENYKTDLRKYIAVYSGGGGSVAMQFAAGGTMDGNLVVTGSISASQYLGIPTGGSDVSGLSANWQNTYTIVQSNSANWNTAYTSLSTKANLSGGNVFNGSQTVVGNLSTTGPITSLSANIVGNLTVDTNTLVVDSVNNRVGIGRTSPGGALEVYTSSGTTGLRVNGGGNGSYLWIMGGNQPNETTTKTGIYTSSASFSRGSMYFLVDTSTDANNANSTDDTKMMIDHITGNVGVNTVSPNQRLTVVGNISATGSVSSASATIPSLLGAVEFGHTGRPTTLATGTPTSTSLITRNDSQLLLEHKTVQIIPILGASGAQNSGSSINATTGCWDLVTSTLSSSGARLSHRIARCLASYITNTDTYTLDRRIIFRVGLTFSQGTPRAGSQFYFQIGRTVNSSTYAQLGVKGLGFGVSNDVVTPFVHNGSTLTNGATFNLNTSRMLVLDWVPASGLYIYGTSGTNSDLTLLSSVTTGLPSGTINDWMEYLLYETGSGTGIIGYTLGNISITIP